MGVMLKLVRRMTVNHVICMDGQFESVCSHTIRRFINYVVGLLDTTIAQIIVSKKWK